MKSKGVDRKAARQALSSAESEYSEEEEDSEEEYTEDYSEPDHGGKQRKKPPTKYAAAAVEQRKPVRLYMCVAQTKYQVVRDAARARAFKLTDEEEEDWDVFWSDGGILPERLVKLKPYQRINHFPGMYALARKNHLGLNLMKMQKVFPEDYKFFPPTWLIPTDWKDFKAQFNKRKAKTFIVKPEASS